MGNTATSLTTTHAITNVTTTRADLDAFNLAHYIGPVVPWAMGATGVVTLLGWGVSAWIRNPNPGLLALLYGGGALWMFLMAWLCRWAAFGGHVGLTGVVCLGYVVMVSVLFCYLAYNNGTGLLQSLPYCMVLACMSGFFWPNWWSLGLGTLGTMLPPYLLMRTLNDEGFHTRLAYAQVLGLTVVISIFLYLLMNRVRKGYVTLLQQVEEQSRRDVLTGLLNRRSWYDCVQRLRVQPGRRSESSCVLYLDVDFFKSVNDRLGHAEGDRVLQQVGMILAASPHLDVQASRFGGEEFVIYMPSAGERDAIVESDRIRSSLRAASEDLGIEAITVSVGIAEITAGESLEDAMRRADTALLQAKSEGRNRVVVANVDIHTVVTEGQLSMHDSVASAGLSIPTSDGCDWHGGTVCMSSNAQHVATFAPGVLACELSPQPGLNWTPSILPITSGQLFRGQWP